MPTLSLARVADLGRETHHRFKAGSAANRWLSAVQEGSDPIDVRNVCPADAERGVRVAGLSLLVVPLRSGRERSGVEVKSRKACDPDWMWPHTRFRSAKIVFYRSST